MVNARTVISTLDRVAAQYTNPYEADVFRANSIDLLLELLDVHITPETRDELRKVKSSLLEKISNY